MHYEPSKYARRYKLLVPICLGVPCSSFALPCSFHHSLNELVCCVILSQLTGDNFQISFALPQWKNRCSMVSSSSPHCLHIASTFIPRFFRFTHTGILSWQALHIKCWIFFLISSVQTFFHNYFSFSSLLVLDPSPPPACCCLSLANLYPEILNIGNLLLSSIQVYHLLPQFTCILSIAYTLFLLKIPLISFSFHPSPS